MDFETDRTVLIHIGAAKAASTWLQKEFFAKDQFGFRFLIPKNLAKQTIAHPSALEFFAENCKTQFEPFWAAHADKNLFPVVSAERFSGASRIGDHDAKELADRLHSVFPNGCVLYIVREQKSMLLAQYLQYLRRGGRWSLKDFLTPPISDSKKAPYFQWDRFKYDQLVDYYQSIFGADRVCVLPMEMLKREPIGFVTAICNFCNVSTEYIDMDNLPFRNPANPSLSSFTMGLRRRSNALFSDQTSFNPNPLITVKNTNNTWKSKGVVLDRFVPSTLKVWHQRKLQRILQETVGDYFASSNTMLSTQIGMNLSDYGYGV